MKTYRFPRAAYGFQTAIFFSSFFYSHTGVPNIMHARFENTIRVVRDQTTTTKKNSIMYLQSIWSGLKRVQIFLTRTRGSDYPIRIRAEC